MFPSTDGVAPLSGLFHNAALAHFRLQWGLLEPYNIRMEPARPRILCDHVAAARGSFGTLDGDQA